MITFNNVGRAYRNKNGEIQWVVRNFSARLPTGLSVGILARPDSGKTTLINLVAGNELPSEGSIKRGGLISWPFGFKALLNNRLNGRQNLRFLTDSYGCDFKKAYDFVADFSNINKYMDTPLSRYTPDMRHRFATGLFFAMNFDRYLVDDNFLAGSIEFRQKCIDYIDSQRDKISFFIATQNPQLVLKYCQVGGVLDKGQVTLYDSVPEAIKAFRNK